MPIQPADSTIVQKSKVGLGFGIASLVLSAIGLVIGLADLGLLNDPNSPYTYILYSEIGLLFIISASAVVFGIISTAMKSPIGRWVIPVAIANLALVLYLSQFGGY